MSVIYSAGVSHDSPMQFPGGEQHIKEGADSIHPYIVIKGSGAEEYISAAMWIDLQHQRGLKAAAIIPYLPGARQDRGKPFGAGVYANVINDVLRADQVIYFDPHSEVMPGLIRNGTRVDAYEVIQEALGSLAEEYYDGVIAPDRGALMRAQCVANVLDVPLFTASKMRNPESGELSDFEAPSDLPDNGRYLIVDDICDGGGTFLGLADGIGLGNARLGGIRLDLWVSHGIFSGGPLKSAYLYDKFSSIFTTNSHPGHGNSEVSAEVFDIIPTLVDRINL